MAKNREDVSHRECEIGLPMTSIWDFINIPMGYVIRFCSSIVGNHYLFALLIFAVIVEILTLPFGIKQHRNSIKQAKMRPKEMAIRKKYAGREDQATKQKMSMEIQEMYQKEGFSPMAGCLPLLIQFPIIIALYNIVLNPLQYICRLSTDTINGIAAVVKSFPEYADATFNATRNIDLMSAMSKILEKDPNAFASVEGFNVESMADIPNLSIFNGAINLGETPAFGWPPSWLLLIPLLTFVAYFASMKINKKLMYQPSQNDMGCSGKIMDYMMPLMSVFISFGVPAAIGVYWIFKCVLGVIKQFILSLTMPLPKFTEEELKAAEKEYNVKNPTPRASGGKPVRSLHHIDDDDYEDITPAPAKKAEKTEDIAEETKKADQTEEKGKLLNMAPLKEDKPEKKEKKEKKSKKDDNTENDDKN